MAGLPLFPEQYNTYRVSSRRGPTIDWLLRGLEQAGCRIITPPVRDSAPFKVVFQAPDGERIGAIFYLFTISCVPTKNRPADECRFQLKYGKKDGLLHHLWQDPTGLYTTVFLGIDPKTGCWVAADPVLHSPTKMFISVEFKDRDLEAARDSGWHVWEWATDSAGLLPKNPGAGVRPREKTREEMEDEDEDGRRAFTRDELERLFSSPLFTGCLVTALAALGEVGPTDRVSLAAGIIPAGSQVQRSRKLTAS